LFLLGNKGVDKYTSEVVSANCYKNYNFIHNPLNTCVLKIVFFSFHVDHYVAEPSGDVVDVGHYYEVEQSSD
jgi:hypothetical protein